MSNSQDKLFSESNLRTIGFCGFCGGLLENASVEGRTRKRCQNCGRVNYINPIPAVAMLAVKDSDQIMLVRRTAPPEVGYWCLPGGFIELGETPEDAVHRELYEETRLECSVDRLFDVGTVIDGYYGDVIVLAYVIAVTGGEVQAGDDADQVEYFPANKLPPLAFECHMRFIEKLFNIDVGQHPKY